MEGYFEMNSFGLTGLDQDMEYKIPDLDVSSLESPPKKDFQGNMESPPDMKIPRLHGLAEIERRMSNDEKAKRKDEEDVVMSDSPKRFQPPLIPIQNNDPYKKQCPQNYYLPQVYYSPQQNIRRQVPPNNTVMQNYPKQDQFRSNFVDHRQGQFVDRQGQFRDQQGQFRDPHNNYQQSFNSQNPQPQNQQGHYQQSQYPMTYNEFCYGNPNSMLQNYQFSTSTTPSYPVPPTQNPQTQNSQVMMEGGFPRTFFRQKYQGQFDRRYSAPQVLRSPKKKEKNKRIDSTQPYYWNSDKIKFFK